VEWHRGRVWALGTIRIYRIASHIVAATEDEELGAS